MASVVRTELDARKMLSNRTVRAKSLSLTSHLSLTPRPTSPLASSPFPAATNTSTGISTSASIPFRLPSSTPNSPPLPYGSPTAMPVPTNTPTMDSGISSPSDTKSANQFHLPLILEAHHFPSPLLSPSVPPNSPESFPFNVNFTDSSDIPEDMSVSLGERLAALSLAAHKTDGFTHEEVKVLNEAVPKAPDNEFYEVRAIPGKGYGCFATQTLKPGTRILADSPLLSIPLHKYYQADIQASFDKLSPTDKALYFTLHSAHGQPTSQWPSKIHDSVDAKERERIAEQHNARVGKEPSLISIFQTNCMEMGKGAAVFPHASRFNHSCNPNASFAWNEAIRKETIHIMNQVEKGDQITLSYCDMTHDKMLRRWELKHYGFICDCPACGDDDDPKSYASKSAERRYRITELLEATRFFHGPRMEEGFQDQNFINLLLELAGLHIQEGDRTERLASVYVDIAMVCEYHGDFLSAREASRKALETKRNCHGTDSADNNKYEILLNRIRKLCADQATKKESSKKESSKK